MGKDGFLTPKAIANRIKAKGLQKLRFFCQVCEKQCRDANGFKCHCESEGHIRQMAIVSQNTSSFINNYSQQFEKEFMDLVRSRWRTKKVHANVVYSEFVSHRLHTHMNSTQWATLSEFVKYLGRTGKVTAEETPKGWYIRYIDRGEIERKAAADKKERMDMDDEERTLRFIEQQKIRASSLLGDMNSDISINNINNNNNNNNNNMDISNSHDNIKIVEDKNNNINSEENKEINGENKEGDDKEKDKDVKKEKIKMEFGKKPTKFQFNVNIKSNNNKNNDDKSDNASKEVKKEEESKSEDKSKTVKSKSKFLLEDDEEEEEPAKKKEETKDHWLREKIIVKVKNKKLEGGIYYNKKGIVRKVHNKYSADVEIIGDGDIIRLDQSFLETVIPQAGSEVMIVNTSRAGQIAVLVDILSNSANLRMKNGQSISLNFDHFCKFDPKA